jgi:hypothetical protein
VICDLRVGIEDIVSVRIKECVDVVADLGVWSELSSMTDGLFFVT